jgi:DNA-binding MurR/RpiR family transcriptional regulator
VKVLRALGTHPREMSFASTAQAAALAGVNAATVVRAAQLLGYSGWPPLRSEMRSRYLSGLSASEVLSEHGTAGGGPAWATLRRELQNLQDLALLLDEEQVQRVARLVFDARVTLVLGSGSFAAPGLQFSHLAQTLGHDVRLHRAGGTSLVNAVCLLQEGDCLLVFHLWRSPREIHNAMRIAAGAGVSLVLVSDQAGGDLSELSEELVLVPSEGSSMFPSLVAATTVVQATIASLVSLDPSAAAAASDRVEELWATYGLFPDPAKELQ